MAIAGKQYRNSNKWINAANAAVGSVKDLKKVLNFGKRVVNMGKQSVRNQRKKSKSRAQSGSSRTKVIGKGLAGETSTTVITNRPPKKSTYNVVKKFGNGSTAVFQQTNSDTVAAGLQKATTFSILNGQAEMQSIWLNIANFYNPFAPAVVASSNTQAGFKSSKFLLKRCHMKLELTNQSPSITNIEIWTCMSKITTATYSSPASDWNNGIGDENGGVAVSNTRIGSRPTQSKLFNMNWKVKSVKKIQLMGGQTHTNVCDFKINRYMDTEYFNQFPQIRGITVAVFLISWGQVADTTNGPAVGSISTTPCKIIGNQVRTYSVDMVNVYPRQYFTAPTTLVQEPITNLYVVNEESGLVANVQDQAANTAYA